jgi:hypothetical protein
MPVVLISAKTCAEREGIMNLLYWFLFGLLLSFIYLSTKIHTKLFGKNYINLNHWYSRIIK